MGCFRDSTERRNLHAGLAQSDRLASMGLRAREGSPKRLRPQGGGGPGSTQPVPPASVPAGTQRFGAGQSASVRQGSSA